MEEQDLFPIFQKFGPMEDVVIIRDKHTGQHRGCAFVTFLNEKSADEYVPNFIAFGKKDIFIEITNNAAKETGNR